MEDRRTHARHEALKQYKAMVSGERIEVVFNRTAGRIEANIGGRSYSLDATAVEPSVYWLNWNQQSFELTVLEHAGEYIVSIGPYRISVEIVDPRKALRRAAHSGQDGAVEIRAPMPGKIVRVLARENAAVEAGQSIVVMEAMKMQNEIKSPKKGVVRKLGVSDGAAVNSGDLLATVE